MIENNENEKLSMLAVFAHPDDETIMMGGTLAFYARRGIEVNLLCATRGEWGSISDSSLCRQEDLGAVRENELQNACAVLGANLLGFLDCPDANVNQTDWSEVQEKIVRYIRKTRPQVVVTFGPDGLYAHPDHVAIGSITTMAFASAGKRECFKDQIKEGLEPFQPQKLYYALYPAFLMRQMAARIIEKNNTAHLWGFSTESFGVSAHEITTMINVGETLTEKMEAIRTHKSQFAADNIFSLIDDETANLFLIREYFRLAQPPPASEKLERDLFAGITSEKNCGLDNFSTLQTYKELIEV